jgi:ribonuclease T1
VPRPWATEGTPSRVLLRLALVAALTVALLGWALDGCAQSGGRHDVQASDVPAVALAQLPPEAAATLALIDHGGPFPYDRDGVVFENREGLLPAESSGYYHEYTVPTPGATDRGARRIIQGSAGELYWTDDHYQSFERIER